MRAKNPHKKTTKRLGRGAGSGHGKTSAKGHKGQRSRSGYSSRTGFEGGQNPLYRRLPKRGFSHNRFATKPTIINLGLLASIGQSEVTPEILHAHGVLKKSPNGVKVLGHGELKKAITVKAHYFSASAKEKIEKAGGKAVLIETTAPPKAEKAEA